ncbi:AlpA family phage regulatory protein [Thalassotalea sp. 1_MG-2023]|uniref:helix-turn-helix transcriptional regulator n=1 Tax=Thalassotalea sp. 1_MG-2023 TaxID=3062680 RepID=UPI0026E3760C|nr:AlpA family phage regulatory protein [Thalassotalea sp. 1_MG-2023]MDO6426198.1 AlpA family phage regulatory protein [Thalassotalea sp. 1_MG-2023]
MNQNRNVNKLTNVKGEEISLNESYLSIKEVVEKCGVSRSTILRLESAKKFPPSHNITDNRKVWFESDVQLWRTLGAQAFYAMYGKQLEQQVA